MAATAIPYGLRALLALTAGAGVAQKTGETLQQSEGINVKDLLVPKEDNQPNPLQQVLLRTLLGPTAEIFNRTTDTPSGKVFAPTGEVIESNQIPGMASAEQPQGLPGLLIPQQEKQVEGMSQASPPTKDKGFTMPTAEDMKILYKKAPVATKELNQLGEDQIKSFIEGQDNLYNDYEIKWNEGEVIKAGGMPKNKLLTKEDIVETYPGQYKPLHRYWEDIWEGGVGDTGQRIAGDIMRAAGTETTKEGFSAPSYYEDYRSRLEEHARKTLGKTFPGYRLMSRGEMENLLEGGEATEEVKSYSLSKDKALWFQNFLGNADKKDDLVLAEAPLFADGLIMRGKPQEAEIVYDNQFTFPKEMNFYDLDGNLIKGAEEGMFSKPKEQPTETVPTQEDNKFNIAYELDPKLIDEMLVARGGTKKFQERMKTMAAPMPASTKDKMFPILADKLMAKYKFDQTDKYEKFEDIPKDELEILQKKYRTKLNAIDYIVSSVYDVIGGKKSNTERDTIFAVDNDGLPVAAVKLGSGEISGAKAKKTIAIEEAGSVFPEAMDRVLEDVKKLAKERGLKFIVAEDLTTDEGYEAFKKRGFKPTTSEKYKMFKGKKIRRPNGKVAYQKNLVFELEPKEKNTSKSAGSLIDKPLSDE